MKIILKITVLIVLVITGVVKPLQIRAQFHNERAFENKHSSDLYDERGFQQGKALTVDGKLVVSTSNGNVSYSYPVGEVVSNGHKLTTTLNYCGSVNFTAFRKWNNSSLNGSVNDSWEKFTQNKPAWLIGVNGFAIQSISYATQFMVRPSVSRIGDPSGSSISNGYEFSDDGRPEKNTALLYNDLPDYPELTQITERTGRRDIIWVMDGYDFCNRMERIQRDGDQDVIRILRSDGSLLELRNHRSTYGGSTPFGSTSELTDETLYTGYYYVNEPNSEGFAIVKYDSIYWHANMKQQGIDESPLTCDEKAPVIPRRVHYFPGDGLEYIFREWVTPYGEGPYRSRGPIANGEEEGTLHWGGKYAGPTIFYLEEINANDGPVANFKRKRHNEIVLDPSDCAPDQYQLATSFDRSSGRAPATTSTACKITYSDMLMNIEVAGKTTKLRFDRNMYFHSYEELVQHSKIRSISSYEFGSSDIGMITSIEDDQGRITKFGYETYERKYDENIQTYHLSFPYDNSGETFIDYTLSLKSLRLTNIIEPTAKYKIDYLGDLNKTLDYEDYQFQIGNPYRLSAILNNVAHLVTKRDRLNNTLLSRDEYQFSVRENDPIENLHFGLVQDQMPLPSNCPTNQGNWITRRSRHIAKDYKKHSDPGVSDGPLLSTKIMQYDFATKRFLHPRAYDYNSAGIQNEGSFTSFTEVRKVVQLMTNSANETITTTTITDYDHLWKNLPPCSWNNEPNDPVKATCYKPYLIKPVTQITREKVGSGPDIEKSHEEYCYETDYIRDYGKLDNGLPDATDPVVKQLGLSITKQTTTVYQPNNPSLALYYTTKKYKHLPLTLAVPDWYNKGILDAAQSKRNFREHSVASSSAPFSYGEAIDKHDQGILANIKREGWRYFAPKTYLLIEEYQEDASHTYLGGIRQTFHETVDNPASLYQRGMLKQTDQVAKGGIKQITSTVYEYNNFNNQVSLIKNPLGSKKYFHYNLYENNDDIKVEGELSRGFAWRDDDTRISRTLNSGEYGYWFAQPLAERQEIRRYNSTSGSVTSALTNLYERSYMGQISAKVDPNGIYSQYVYDRLGRILMVRLPYDFASITKHTNIYNGWKSFSGSGGTLDKYLEYKFECENGGLKPGWGYTDGGLHPKEEITFAFCKAGGDYSSWTDVIDIPTCEGKNANSLNHRTFFHEYRALITLNNKHQINSIQNANLEVFVAGISGQCVTLRATVPGTAFSQTFVLSCPPVLKNSNSTLAAPKSTQKLKITFDTEVKNKIKQASNSGEAVDVYIDVLTSNATVEFTNETSASEPTFNIEGEFEDIITSDLQYTLQYEHHNYFKYGTSETAAHSIVTAKIDDDAHTADPDVSSSNLFIKRTTSTTHYFGADFRVLESRTPVTGFPSPVTVKNKYSGLGLKLEVEDQLQKTTKTEYDGLGRAFKVTLPAVAINGNPSTIGERTTVYWSGLPPTSLGTSQDFYGFCSIETTTDEVYTKFRKYFDAFGRLRREVADFDDNVNTTALNLTTYYNYDIQGRLTDVTNPEGHTTQYWYDDFGRVKTKYQPDMGYISYAYDKAGNVRFVQSQSQADSNKVTFTQYDDLNRPVVVGEARVSGSNPIDPPIGLVGRGGKDKKTSNSVLSVSAPSSRWTDILNPDVINDGGQSTILTVSKTPWLAPVRPLPVIWGVVGNLSEVGCVPSIKPKEFANDVIPPFVLKHPAVRYQFPNIAAASPTTFEDLKNYPEHGLTIIHYDEMPQDRGAAQTNSIWGLMPPLTTWQKLMPKGSVRNLKGRQSAVAYRNHGGEPYNYSVMSYDERGRVEALVRYTDNIGFDAVYYTYNSMNAVTSIRVVDVQRQHITWYGYDDNGRQDKVWTELVQSGFITTAPNSLNSPMFPATPAVVKGAPVKSPTTLVSPDITYEYTQRNQIDKMTYPSAGTQTIYEYNERGWLQNLIATKSGTNVFTENLAYVNNGQIAGQNWTQGMSPQQTQTYQYDRINRLKFYFSTVGDPVTTYTYDKVGNRTSEMIGGNIPVNTIYSYTDPTGPNRLTATNGGSALSKSYYNPDGGLIKRYKQELVATNAGLFENSLERFRYSAQGLVIQYARGTTMGPALCDNATIPMQSDWRYRYNAGGEREQKRLYPGAALNSNDPVVSRPWTYYLLGVSNEQLAVYHGIETGHTLNQAACGTLGSNVYLYPTEYNSYGKSGQSNISTKFDGTKEYRLYDHLGSTRVTLSSTGAVNSTMDYAPFGDVIASTGGEARLSFIDKERDKESGLGDHGARKMDSDIGRFTSIDALWEKYRSSSPYHYSLNNPIRFFDADGLDVEDVNRLAHVARDHLQGLLSLQSSSKKEWSGILIGTADVNWVRWAGLTEGISSTATHPLAPQMVNDLRGSEAPNSSWGEIPLATAHTHPDDQPFSRRDMVSAMSFSFLPAEKSDGNIKFLVTPSTTFALEITDRKAVNNFLSKNSEKAIFKIYEDAMSKAKGSFAERQIAGVKAVVQASGGMSFYQSVNAERTKFEEVR